MLKLFEIGDDGLPALTPESRTLEPFKNIITKGRKTGRPSPEVYLREIAYVYWFAKFDTHYDQFEGQEKIDEIKRAVGLEKEWKPDKFIQEAIDFFLSTQRTKYMRHLEAAEASLNMLSDYLRTADPNERIQAGPKRGELVHDLTKIKNLQKELPDLIEAAQKTKDLVYKEMQENTANRAGRQTNKYNE